MCARINAAEPTSGWGGGSPTALWSSALAPLFRCLFGSPWVTGDASGDGRISVAPHRWRKSNQEPHEGAQLGYFSTGGIQGPPSKILLGSTEGAFCFGDWRRWKLPPPKAQPSGRRVPSLLEACRLPEVLCLFHNRQQEMRRMRTMKRVSRRCLEAAQRRGGR